MLTNEELRVVIELICKEQIDMIVKDHSSYDSEDYQFLEKLKVKVKDM